MPVVFAEEEINESRSHKYFGCTHNQTDLVLVHYMLRFLVFANPPS